MVIILCFHKMRKISWPDEKLCFTELVMSQTSRPEHGRSTVLYVLIRHDGLSSLQNNTTHFETVYSIGVYLLVLFLLEHQGLLVLFHTARPSHQNHLPALMRGRRCH